MNRCSGVALVALVAFACTRADDTRKDPSPVPVPVPNPLPVKPAEDPGRVLLAHTSDKEAAYLAITLPDGKGAPAFEELGKLGTAIASFDRGRWVYAGDDQPGDQRVVVAVPSATSGGKPTYQLGVPALPAALRVVKDALYVGMAGSFGWLDLSAPKPAYVELVKRPGFAHKPYDRFAREGDRLLAIDDEVVPMYADWYALDGAGKPVRRLADWTLPNIINGHYMKAGLLPTGTAADFTLYLIAWYGVRSGDGQVLISVPVKNDQLVFDRDVSLPNRDGKLAAIVEYAARGGGGRKDELLAGDKLTHWHDLAIARRANKLLLAALGRGMMVVPANFGPRSKDVEVVDLGGDVWAIRAHGERLFALVVKDTAGELVELDSLSLKPIARHALPAPYHQFVD
jgi:hypothetical protein